MFVAVVASRFRMFYEQPYFSCPEGKDPVTGDHDGKKNEKDSGIEIHFSLPSPMLIIRNTMRTTAASVREAPLMRRTAVATAAAAADTYVRMPRVDPVSFSKSAMNRAAQ